LDLKEDLDALEGRGDDGHGDGGEETGGGDLGDGELLSVVDNWHSGELVHQGLAHIVALCKRLAVLLLFFSHYHMKMHEGGSPN
jgi:hypothetical protein